MLLIAWPVVAGAVLALLVLVAGWLECRITGRPFATVEEKEARERDKREQRDKREH